LEIAVPLDNPAQIAGLADLARPGVRLVTCAPEVPCGAAAQRVAVAARVSLRPVSEESSVTDVLNKVQTGEADAGLVYVTDVKAAAGKVQGVPFPEARRAVNEYPIAVLAGSRQPQLAEEFLALVTGPRGREVLADAGFTLPRPNRGRLDGG
jgi:molybdate transport system substrate-binding protein